MDGPQVVAAEDGDGPGQGLDPGLQLALVGNAVDAFGEKLRLVRRLNQQTCVDMRVLVGKGLFAAMGECHAGDAAKGQVPKASGTEEVPGKSADAVVVRIDTGDSGVDALAEDVDGREPRVDESGREPFVGDAGDDAVEVFQFRREGLLDAEGTQDPVAAFLGEGRDAFDHRAPVGTGVFDHDGNLSHGGSIAIRLHIVQVVV